MRYWAAQWHLARAAGRRFRGCRAKRHCLHIRNGFYISENLGWGNVASQVPRHAIAASGYVRLFCLALSNRTCRGRPVDVLRKREKREMQRFSGTPLLKPFDEAISLWLRGCAGNPSPIRGVLFRKVVHRRSGRPVRSRGGALGPTWSKHLKLDSVDKVVLRQSSRPGGYSSRAFIGSLG